MSVFTIDDVINYTAFTEGGGRYDAINSNDAGAGVSYGLIQFNQGGGRQADKAGSPLAALFKLLRASHPTRFDEVFGPYAQNLLDTSWVKHADLATADFRARLKVAGGVPAFQQVQRDAARASYYDPMVSAAEDAGIRSARGMAMLFDASVQMGPARAKTFLREAAGPGGGEFAVLSRFAAIADDPARVSYVGTARRRGKILTDARVPDTSVGDDSEGVEVGSGKLLLLGGALVLWLGYRWWRM